MIKELRKELSCKRVLIEYYFNKGRMKKYKSEKGYVAYDTEEYKYCKNHPMKKGRKPKGV